MTYVLLVHALISIIVSIGSAVLYSRTWDAYLLERTHQELTEHYFPPEFTPLQRLSFKWASITCGLLLIWTSLLMHVVSYLQRWLPAVPT